MNINQCEIPLTGTILFPLFFWQTFGNKGSVLLCWKSVVQHLSKKWPASLYSVLQETSLDWFLIVSLMILTCSLGLHALVLSNACLEWICYLKQQKRKICRMDEYCLHKYLFMLVHNILVIPSAPISLHLNQVAAPPPICIHGCKDHASILCATDSKMSKRLFTSKISSTANEVVWSDPLCELGFLPHMRCWLWHLFLYKGSADQTGRKIACLRINQM